MADESVVVMKSRPVKAGNRLEGKTGMILHIGGCRKQVCAKSHICCEGRKFIRRLFEDCINRGFEHKSFDGMRHFAGGRREKLSAGSGRSSEYLRKPNVYCPLG